MINQFSLAKILNKHEAISLLQFVLNFPNNALQSCATFFTIEGMFTRRTVGYRWSLRQCLDSRTICVKCRLVCLNWIMHRSRTCSTKNDTDSAAQQFPSFLKGVNEFGRLPFSGTPLAEHFGYSFSALLSSTGPLVEFEENKDLAYPGLTLTAPAISAFLLPVLQGAHKYYFYCSFHARQKVRMAKSGLMKNAVCQYSLARLSFFKEENNAGLTNWHRMQKMRKQIPGKLTNVEKTCGTTNILLMYCRGGKFPILLRKPVKHE